MLPLLWCRQGWLIIFSQPALSVAFSLRLFFDFAWLSLPIFDRWFFFFDADYFAIDDYYRFLFDVIFISFISFRCRRLRRCADVLLSLISRLIISTFHIFSRVASLSFMLLIFDVYFLIKIFQPISIFRFRVASDFGVFFISFAVVLMGPGFSFSRFLPFRRGFPPPEGDFDCFPDYRFLSIFSSFADVNISLRRLISSIFSSLQLIICHALYFDTSIFHWFRFRFFEVSSLFRRFFFLDALMMRLFLVCSRHIFSASLMISRRRWNGLRFLLFVFVSIEPKP